MSCLVVIHCKFYLNHLINHYIYLRSLFKGSYVDLQEEIIY